MAYQNFTISRFNFILGKRADQKQLNIKPYPFFIARVTQMRKILSVEATTKKNVQIY